MTLYAIIRREGWSTPGDLQEAAARSTAVGDGEMSGDIRWIRSYVLSEESGNLGIPIVDTVIVRPDPVAAG